MLIISQSVTFVLLIISETLPFVPKPYNGILHWLMYLLNFFSKPENIELVSRDIT
jgi:hypothetical protein